MVKRVNQEKIPRVEMEKMTPKEKERRYPRKYFSLEEGCRFGQTCKAYHRTLKPEEGKCYCCGSAKHQAHECDRPKRESGKGSPKGDHSKKGKTNHQKGKNDGKGKPSVRQLSTEEQGEATRAEGRELKAEGSDPKEPEREPDKSEKVLEAFQTMMIKAL